MFARWDVNGAYVIPICICCISPTSEPLHGRAYDPWSSSGNSTAAEVAYSTNISADKCTSAVLRLEVASCPAGSQLSGPQPSQKVWQLQDATAYQASWVTWHIHQSASKNCALVDMHKKDLGIYGLLEMSISHANE